MVKRADKLRHLIADIIFKKKRMELYMRREILLLLATVRRNVGTVISEKGGAG